MEKIQCRKCKEFKLSTEFYSDKSRPGGLHLYCKVCQLAMNKDYRQTDRGQERSKRARLKNKYGIVPEERDAMLEAQKGLCAICQMRKPLVVDHHHESGVVRELLCYGCNNAIGFLQDDPELIRAAAAYVERHSLARADSR